MCYKRSLANVLIPLPTVPMPKSHDFKSKARDRTQPKAKAWRQLAFLSLWAAVHSPCSFQSQGWKIHCQLVSPWEDSQGSWRKGLAEEGNEGVEHPFLSSPNLSLSSGDSALKLRVARSLCRGGLIPSEEHSVRLQERWRKEPVPCNTSALPRGQKKPQAQAGQGPLWAGSCRDRSCLGVCSLAPFHLTSKPWGRHGQN